MDPTSEYWQDEQLSENIDGHLSPQSLYEYGYRDNFDCDDQFQSNMDFIPEGKTRLVTFLESLTVNSGNSPDDAISGHVYISLNSDASEAAADIPVETSVNNTKVVATEATIRATSGYPEMALPPEFGEMPRMVVKVPSSEPPYQTPLHIAVLKGLITITEQLIAAGADINAWDANGVQPLHIACEIGNEYMIRLLLAEGATIRGPDHHGWCLLHFATYHDLDLDLLGHLIEADREYLNYRESFQGWTPINRAVWVGCENVIDTLLQAGVDLGIADNNGWTPLMTAIDQKRFKIFDKMVNYLAQFGSNDIQIHQNVVDHRNDKGLTVLMTLCAAEPSHASESSLRHFLQRLRPSTEITDNIDQTALNHAMAQAETSDNPHAQSTALEMINWWPRETLLRQNMSNETAFDGVSGSLLDSMIKRLESDFVLRDKLLCWLAARKERHPTAIQILSKLELRERIAALSYKDGWSLIDWAIYHRMPRVLLKCPAVNDVGTNHGVKILDELKAFHPRSRKTFITERKEDLTPREVLDEMGDLLIFLPQMIEDPKTFWKVSRPSDEMKRCLEHYNAAVVRLRGQEIDAFRFRKVSNVVYGDSPLTVVAIDEIQEWATGGDSYFESTNKTPADTHDTFTWVHLPATNMDWMTNVVMNILRSHGKKTIPHQEKLDSFFQASWAEIPDKTSASRFMRPRYVRMQPGKDIAMSNAAAPYKEEHKVGDAPFKPGFISQDQEEPRSSGPIQSPASALYMPFLTVSQYDEQDDIIKNDETATAASLPGLQPTIQTEQPFERQHLFDAYRGSVLHDSPTLDEHYYHFAEDDASAKDRRTRNKTQVITKYLTPNAEEDDMPKTILRVSQLWAWTIGDKWLITSTSCAKREKGNAFVSEILAHLRRRVDEGNLAHGLRSATDLTEIIADYCIGTYGRKHEVTRRLDQPNREAESNFRQASTEQKGETGRPFHQAGELPEERSIHQIYYEFVKDIGRRETQAFRDFVTQPSTGPTNTAHAPTIRHIQDATRETSGLLLEIKDVRDELNILRTIAEYQRQIQLSLYACSKGSEASVFEINQDLTSGYNCKDIESLEELSHRIQQGLQITIPLLESEIANRQAEDSADQGKRVMVFTVVTVWFLPLSFLSSLFALDVESFLSAPWWSLIVIFVVPLPFLLVATAYMRGRNAMKSSRIDVKTFKLKNALDRDDRQASARELLRRRFNQRQRRQDKERGWDV